MKHHRYFIACILPFLFPYSVFGEENVQVHLQEGSDFLSNGQFTNALSSFDAAIRMEPDNYLTYFKRATAYLSLGRNNAAVEDFTKILDLKPDFDKALLQRARIYAKDGQFDLAIHDLEKYLKTNKKDEESKNLLSRMKAAKQAAKQAEMEKEKGNFDQCIDLATTVSRVSPTYIYARLIRAECHVAKGEIDEAAGDFARVAQLNPSDPDILILLSKINFYSLNERQGALKHIKQCLHYDPEQKQCKALFRKMKKLDKELTKIENDINLKKYTTAANYLIGTANREGILKNVDAEFEAFEKEMKSSKLPRKLHFNAYQMACKIYGSQKKENKNEEKIETWCSKVLEIADDLDAYTYRGEVYLNKKDFEAAVRDLEKAYEISEGRDNRVRQLLQKAQQKLKLSKKRDYYKILGVSHDADSREIKKAYRKKAHEWHPDKYNGDLSKEEVESKMAEINQAYEVLSDEDKRQQYDNGFDPFDPEHGQGGGEHGGAGPNGFPFHFAQGGGFPFGGFPFSSGGGPFGGAGNGFPGGAQFKMHFG
ncbi:hypothetical protein BDF20DRAFT_820978 [Mycotypha africana]|uniref:uncharacterized protein n=1 Tax=Mycotypha africana TaxID=64632 RepID=UPI0023012ACD|nr:uncharacterized protein BDF20DRAFT_820978 [Mycotypha africana]KAI8977362.1 hypothetical protein BDF20DRAFT_820978 [Mycotypha africana]